MYVYRDIDDEQYTYKFSDEEKIKRSNGEKSDDEHQKDYPKHAVKHRLNTTGVLQRADMLVSTHDIHGATDSTNFDYVSFLKFAKNIYVLYDKLKSTTSKLLFMLL